MPLFHDPDRRRQYRWSVEEMEHEQTPGSSHESQAKEDHRGPASTELAGLNWSSRNSPAGELSPTRMWSNDRQELIQRIKESSPWRLEYMVC